MTILVVGGAGFIGRRMIPMLVNEGHDVVCADINFGLAAHILEPLAPKVRMVRADVTQFDDMVRLVHEVKPKTLVNLSYFIGSDMPPHVATKLNVVGMDNCFEAARLGGVQHTVFASSLAVSGPQKNFGERMVNEDDPKHGDTPIRREQDLQRVSGPGLPREIWHDDHLRPPGQRDRTGQGGWLHRPRALHGAAGPRPAG